MSDFLTAVDDGQPTSWVAAAHHAAGTDWGLVATWISALGTFLAFLVALCLYAAAGKDRRGAQARLVTAWASSNFYRLKAGESAAIPARGDRPLDVYMPSEVKTGKGHTVTNFPPPACDWGLVNWYVVNGSDETISQIDCAVIGWRHFRKMRQMPEQSEWLYQLHFLPAKYMHQSTTQLHMDRWDGFATNGLVIRICFTDAAGRRWEHTTGQPLRRLDSWHTRVLLKLKLIGPLNPANSPQGRDECDTSLEDQARVGKELRSWKLAGLPSQAPWRLWIRRRKILQRWRTRPAAKRRVMARAAREKAEDEAQAAATRALRPGSAGSA